MINGIDYSTESVAMSRKKNAAYLGNRCSIIQGTVMAMPFRNACYDAVTAIETVYFWPDLVGGLQEIHRILKSGGEVLIVCEVNKH